MGGVDSRVDAAGTYVADFSVDVEQQFMVATEPATDLHRGFARFGGHEPRVAPLNPGNTMLVA